MVGDGLFRGNGMDGHGRGVRALASVAVCAVLLVVAGPAYGDGCVFPERAYILPATIPNQTALIVYRNGQERLVVESAVDAEGQSFGWIVPVPAAPTELKVATPGILRSLERTTEPALTHDLGQEMWFAVLWALVAVATLAYVVIMRPRLIHALIAGFALFWPIALVFAFFTAFGGIKQGSDLSRITALQAGQFGSYDVAVLEAKDASSLNAWLEKSGFVTLPSDGLEMTDDYIRKGWVFVTAKLRREGGALCVPHPLSITFPAAAPVYPMRLTGLGGKPLQLELLVVADGRAHVDWLGTDYCDALTWKEDPDGMRLGLTQGEAHYKGRTFRRPVGHPDAAALLWDGAVLTRLLGTVPPHGMMEDFRIGLSPMRARLGRAFSSHGALQAGLIIALYLWSLAIVIVMLFRLKRIRAAGGRFFAIGRIALPATLAALVAGAAVYAALPKVPVNVVGREFPGMTDPGSASMYYAVKALTNQRDELSGLATDEIRAHVATYFSSSGMKNPITGSPIADEDTPGNYVIREDADGVTLRFFDRWGFPTDLALTQTGAGVRQ